MVDWCAREGIQLSRCAPYTPEQLAKIERMWRTLGEGAFGKVRRCLHKGSGQVFALKQMCKSDIVQMGQVEHIMQETQILSTITHPFVTNKFGGFVTKANLILIMEFCPGGDLFDQLYRHKSFSLKDVRIFSSQILLPLEYLHALGIVHRDLKLENVMLCAEDPRAVKIVDFGLAVDYTAGQLFREKVGSKSYRSPEILAGAGYEGPPADVWALGIVIFSLAAGFFPLDEARSTDWRFARLAQEQAKEVGACDAIFAMYKRACPFTQDFKAMLDGMLTIDPKKRATVAGLSENRWLETPKIGAQGEYDEDGVVYRSLGGGGDDEARPPLQLDEMMPTIGRQRAGCLE